MQHADVGEFEVFDASKYKVAVVVSRFNNKITDQLLESALKGLQKHKVSLGNIRTVYTSGSIELPVLLQKLAKTKKYDCLVAIGAVIRGETAHFEYVCKFVTEGILRVQLDEQIPIGYGILTCDTVKQAQARTNLGGGYAEVALQSAKALKTL